MKTDMARMPTNPQLGRSRWEDQQLKASLLNDKFETSLGYMKQTRKQTPKATQTSGISLRLLLQAVTAFILDTLKCPI